MMIDADHAALTAYLRQIADHLRMVDWEVEVQRDPCEEDAFATYHRTRGKQYASIRVCENFFDLPPEQQRETTVHELLHGPLEFARLPLEDIKAFLPEAVYALADTTMLDAIEIAVHRLSLVLAPTLPLPEFADA